MVTKPAKTRLPCTLEYYSKSEYYYEKRVEPRHFTNRDGNGNGDNPVQMDSA